MTGRLTILGLCTLSLGWGAASDPVAAPLGGAPVAAALYAAQDPAATTQMRWGVAVLRQKPEWYGSVEARAVADSVLQYQSSQGGWPKSTDLAVAPRSPEDIPPEGQGRANSLDNDATTLPMQFLALVAHATGERRYREAFARGIDYLLAAQYPNGGWPQFYPLRDDYYSRITFNDDAMVRAMIVLRDAAAGKPPYAFVDEVRRTKAAAAVARGIDFILRTQIRQEGNLTAWGAQYDEKTLAPAWARKYEPPSLSGSESVGIVRFLMSIEHPTPEVVAAVQGAVRWFRAVAIHGLRLEEVTDAEGKHDRRVIADPAAAPLWARFYELNTNRPIFLGRDSVVRYVFSEIEVERRGGYNYYGTWPATLLSEDYPRWREKHGIAESMAIPQAERFQGPTPDTRPRIIVSSDIGGTDPDDIQSMVHLLLYADMFDVEGLISSPWGPGRRDHILEVIDRYAQDYAALKKQSARYPAPDALRAVAKQGAIDLADGSGVGRPTEGSEWIVRCARQPDPRPLWVLVWGAIDDLAQALHDAPDILPKLRVYFIGGPNKMWSVDAYDYIETHHPALWMIEANSTYRGWFVGGDQSGDWDNRTFAAAHAKGRGMLGDYFAGILGGVLKMGDSPSVGYLLSGASPDPGRGGWGGRFVPVWADRKTVFTRLTTAADEAEAFGVVEIRIPVPEGMTPSHHATMMVDGRIPAKGIIDGGQVRFRFSPRDAKVWPYVIDSDVAALQGLKGEFTAVLPPPARTARRSSTHVNWWTDDPDPSALEGVHRGARTVNQWRVAFLRDFAERLRRTTPLAKGVKRP